MGGRAGDWVANRLTNRRWQLAVCVVAMTAIASPQYTWTLFTEPLALGLSAQLSQVQVAFTLFILTQSWLVPVLGYVMDLLGARVVVALGGILVGLSWVGAGLANSLWELYLFYAMGGVGVAAVYGACIGLVLKWFPDRRGLAAGLAVGAYGSGAALTVVPIRHLIEGAGYRTAFMIWGFLLGAVIVLAAWPMMMPHPGWRAPEPARRLADTPPRTPHRVASVTPFQMVRSGTFYLLYLVAVLVTFGGLMVSAQLKPIAVAHGIDTVPLLPGVDALALALMTNLAVAAVARPFWGWLSDRIGRYRTMALAFALGGAAIFGFLELAGEPLGFVVFSCLTAFTWGASFVLFSAAIGDAFGTDYAATNNGIHYTSKGVAAIFAGWGAARLVEATGSWAPVFWLGVACNLVAAVIVLFVLQPAISRSMVRRREAS
jgi:OFA family oxalate/formate antiporter-like MFS transporter